MMEPCAPRYEFRTFGSKLDRFAGVLSGSAEEEQVEFFSDIYLVSRLTLDVNVKVRDNTLELKKLEARRGMLERWNVIFKCDLPVNGENLKDQVFPELGVDIDIPDGAELRRDGICELARINPSLDVAVLHKERTRYWFASAMAEHVRIGIEDALVRSAAVESAMPEAVEALIARFGLSQHRNQSYPAFLQEHLFARKPAAGGAAGKRKRSPQCRLHQRAHQ